MQIDRLLDMVLLLGQKGRVTAGELAQRFDCSTRTVYRDVDTLSLAGIPVVCTKGKGGGIGLLTGFSMEQSLLTEKERQEIVFALQSLGAARFPEVEKTLSKISSIFRQKAEPQWIEVDFSEWGDSAQEREKFHLLKEAILGRRVLAFGYVSSGGQTTVRQVEALKLIFKAHSWYLWAFCRERQDFRLFRLSRMREVQLLEESFVRILEEGPSTGLERLPVPPMEQLVLEFAPEIAYRVYDEFAHGRVEPGRDGGLRVTCQMPYDEWFLGYLLSFGPELTVLEPAHVREALKVRACTIAAQYQS